MADGDIFANYSGTVGIRVPCILVLRSISMGALSPLSTVPYQILALSLISTSPNYSRCDKYVQAYGHGIYFIIFLYKNF